MFGNDGGTTGIDDDFAARGFSNIGAWIMGRNMFGPIRGPWPDESWKGWWGDTPPYHTPVFILTNHARESVTMDGGTTFHFVTDGIHSALERAAEAANGQDVRLGGGLATIRQYLRAGLVDELHLAIAPILLGSGESLFAGIDMPALGYQCVEHVPTQNATHVVLKTGQANVLALRRVNTINQDSQWRPLFLAAGYADRQAHELNTFAVSVFQSRRTEISLRRFFPLQIFCLDGLCT